MNSITADFFAGFENGNPPDLIGVI